MDGGSIPPSSTIYCLLTSKEDDMRASDYTSLAALVISIFSAYTTLKVNRRGIELDTYHRATELFLKLNETFITYPELRPYFYDGRTLDAVADQKLREQVKMTAELILDVFDWVSHDCEGASKTDRESWFDFMRSMFDNSPILLEYHTAHREWHPVLDKNIFGQ